MVKNRELFSMNQSSQWEKSIFILVLSIAALFLFITLEEVFLFGVDDSYIFYRYAENLANGHGLVFNVGEPEGEGFTSWTWLLLLAFFKVLGLDIILVSKILGIMFHIGGGVMIYLVLVKWLGNNSTGRMTGLMGVICFWLNYRLIAHSVSGMETAQYIFAILGMVYLTVCVRESWTKDGRQREWLWMSLATALLFLVRPEGIVVGGISLLVLASRDWRVVFSGRVWGYIALGLLGPVGGIILMKVLVFGYAMPHSYYHKLIAISSEYGESLRQLGLFFKSYGWLFILAVIMLVLKLFLKPVLVFEGKKGENGTGINERDERNKRCGGDGGEYVYFVLLLVGMSGVYLLFYPAMNYLHRFYMPYMPLLLLLIMPGVYYILNFINGLQNSVKVGRRGVVMVLVFLLLGGGLVMGINWDRGEAEQGVKSWSKMVDREKYRARLGVLMADLPGDIVVANSEMGVIPYFSRLTCIDMAGLTDPYISHHGLDMVYLEKRGVGLILFPRDVSEVSMAEWEQYTLNYKGVFLSKVFRTNYKKVGVFGAWPGGRKKYYLYADQTAPGFASILEWCRRYRMELQE